MKWNAVTKVSGMLANTIFITHNTAAAKRSNDTEFWSTNVCVYSRLKEQSAIPHFKHFYSLRLVIKVEVTKEWLLYCPSAMQITIFGDT
jgi:hypothetical protein